MYLKTILIFSALLLLTSCFGSSSRPYPAEWSKLKSGYQCPDVSGQYVIDSATAVSFAENLTQIKLEGVSTDAIKKINYGFYDIPKRKLELLKRIEAEKKMQKISSFKINQKACNRHYISFFDEKNQIVIDKSKRKSLRCLPIEFQSYDNQFFTTHYYEREVRSAHSIMDNQERLSLGTNTQGQLIVREGHYDCGVGMLLLVPLPECKQTENIWDRYQKVRTNQEYKGPTCY